MGREDFSVFSSIFLESAKQHPYVRDLAECLSLEDRKLQNKLDERLRTSLNIVSTPQGSQPQAPRLPTPIEDKAKVSISADLIIKSPANITTTSSQRSICDNQQFGLSNKNHKRRNYLESSDPTYG